jgi:hypothetical protein
MLICANGNPFNSQFMTCHLWADDTYLNSEGEER